MLLDFLNHPAFVATTLVFSLVAVGYWRGYRRGRKRSAAIIAKHRQCQEELYRQIERLTRSFSSVPGKPAGTFIVTSATGRQATFTGNCGNPHARAAAFNIVAAADAEHQSVAK